MIDRVSRIKIGDPKDDKTEFGAISSKGHFDKILKYIKIAKNEGGEILLGGSPIQIKGRCENGYYINPTIIDSLDNTSIINQDEIFGPVVTLQSFDSEEEAMKAIMDNKIQEGDIIVVRGDELIFSTNQLVEVLGKKRVDWQVEIDRGGKLMSVVVRL